MHTRFSYLYRDGSNYKQYGEVILAGVPADLDAANAAIVEAANEYEWFIAEQLGLENLRERWDSHYEDDHCWHELAEPALSIHEGDQLGHEPVEDFVARFVATGTDDGWDERTAIEHLETWVATTRQGS